MGFTFYLFMGICALSAFFIIITVMMQPSKAGGGLGGLGGGAGVTDSVFGANRSTILAKVTWVLAIIFLASSLILGVITSNQVRQDKDENAAPSILEGTTETTVTTPETGTVNTTDAPKVEDVKKTATETVKETKDVPVK